jgi:hypothetical protein
MSAAPSTPPARGRHELASVPRGPRWRPVLLCALAGVLVSSLGGCASEADGAATPAPSTSSPSTPSASPVDEQAALLAQYRKFWESLTPISRLPATERQPALAELAVDPALKSLLDGMRQADTKGQVFYGTNVPRPEVRINPDATTALVDDCQDSSSAGIAKKGTEERVTVGVERNHVSVTMKKQRGGQWRVAFIDYAKSPC